MMLTIVFSVGLPRYSTAVGSTSRMDEAITTIYGLALISGIIRFDLDLLSHPSTRLKTLDMDPLPSTMDRISHLPRCL